MFAIIGKGQFTKEAIQQFLIDIGISEPCPIIQQIEKRGKILIDDTKILYVR